MQHTNTLAARPGAPLAAWTPTFVMSVEDAVRQVEMKREFFKRCMVEGVHYGVIPGTFKPGEEDKAKKVLFKPGAESLLSSMGLHVELSDAASPILDFTGRDHGGEALIEYRRACTIYRQIGPTEGERMLVARAEGSCSSWEVKYRYRDARPICPDCGLETIARSKEEFGGGWYCNRKAGGCGNNYQKDDKRISEQKLGRVKNPEVAEVANTILKMADKRAFVAATLLATGCSDIFTQDIIDEDDPSLGGDDEPSSGSQRRSNGRSNSGSGRSGNGAGAASDANLAVLQELNERAGKPWSPPVLKGKAGHQAAFEAAKAELEAMIAKAGGQAAGEPAADGPAGDEEPS